MKGPNIPPVTELVDALRSHPGVREAAAFRSSSGHDQPVVVFVVADEAYVDGVLGRSPAEKSQLRVWRKTYDLTQLTKAADTAPLAFNTLGWNSVYTRRPIPEEDMQEWVRTTVERISSLNPKNVLEIGCGTGLLLLRLAPHCTRYVGVDFAPAVLQKLRAQLAQMPEISGRVELRERFADDFEGLAEDSFDTAIINSAAQYFPNLTYLNRVLEKAIPVIKPGGHIFVGDQRSLPLIKTFALSVEAAEAAAETTVKELRGRLKERIRQDQQLVLSPAFYLSIPRRHSKVSGATICPRRGKLDNEMTRFRYDAILWIGPQSQKVYEIPFVVPPKDGWTLDGVKSKLKLAGSDAVGIARIRNSRVDRHVHLLALLEDADPNRSFAQLKSSLDRYEAQGIHPEAIANLAAETGHDVAMSWASCYSDGSFDAAFLPQRPGRPGLLPLINWPLPAPVDTIQHASEPGKFEIREQLAADLKNYLRALLPEWLAPQIHIVDSLPKVSDGTVDDGTVDYDALISSHESFLTKDSLV